MSRAAPTPPACPPEGALRPASLPAELKLILERWRLRARLRAAWLRRLWSEEPGHPSPGAITHAEVDAALEDHDAPEAEARWIASDPAAAKLYARVRAVEEKLRTRKQSRLAQFESIFGLEAPESDLLQACLGVAVDPSLGRVCAYLQDQAGRPSMTSELAARLYGHGHCGPWTAESALFRWELVEERQAAPGELPALLCDPVIRDWFLGRTTLAEVLVGAVDVTPPLEPLEGWPADEAMQFIQRTAHGAAKARVRLTLSGPPGSGRRTLAALIASRLRLPLMVVNCDALEDQDWRRAYLRAQRHAYLFRVALAWDGAAQLRRPCPQTVAPFPIQFSLVEPGQTPPPAAGVLERRFEMPALTVRQRSTLWRQFLPASQEWTPEGFETLVSRHRAHVGEIAAIGREGLAQPEAAAVALREAARGRLGDLAQLLECPFDWDDIVLGAHVREALEDLVYEASARAAFWDQPHTRRLFPQGRGLLALFSGPPGTGKTMAAQVIAARLGMDLYRIDLSALVSKWVGETSKNIENLLRKAATMDAVLLFDEADALFSKRTPEVRDAQDRFANMDAAHLMVSIENYSGVVLLATNMKANIDPAFLRRIRYVVDFAKPDAAQRLEIWRKIVGGLAGEQTLLRLEEDLKRVATGLETTGAQIKYGVLAAAFVAQRAAAPLALEHLLRGLNRELIKEGRALTERDRERVLGHAR